MLSVVLPIHNEKENIEPLLTEIQTALNTLRRPYEVICVDDGSRDGSTELLIELAKKLSHLRVIVLRKNYGQTAAFAAGFEAASGDIVVSMDADGQNDPADIPRMVKKLEEGFDCVIGFRKNRHDGMFLRIIPSRIANWIIRRVTGSKFKDLGCSLRICKKEYIKELSLYGDAHRFLSILIADLGARVAEVETHHRPRMAGQSKYNLSRTTKVVVDLFALWFWIKYKTRPMRLFGLMGLIFSAVALLCFLAFVANVFDAGSILAPVLVAFALQFFGLGLLADFIARFYLERTRGPVYSVREIHDGNVESKRSTSSMMIV